MSRSFCVIYLVRKVPIHGVVKIVIVQTKLDEGPTYSIKRLSPGGMNLTNYSTLAWV